MKGGMTVALLVLAREASSFWDIFSFVDQIDTLQAIILIAGLILLIAEIFLPGFGIAGGSGIALIILGIILTAETFFEAFIMFLLLLVVVAIVLTIVIRSARKGKLSRTLILQSAARREDGYSSSNDPRALIGLRGQAVTSLRPAGTAEFDGIRIDVVTNGSFIEKGTPVRIITAYGSRIVVEPDRSDSMTTSAPSDS
jgi:membrane-bound ClpP family serine protease